jgi:2-oxoisovalerate dehydrogenase E1 component alpha subunit
MFPGAVKSAFSNTMRFEQPAAYPALPTYRVVDQHGVVVDPAFAPDLSDEEVVKLYRDMLTVSIMDVIMFDAQRQGRLSFYMVSAGEEAVSVATASALTREDVVFCQYREQGVFKQRGFTLGDFMNQLFANQKDPGKGRNMPVHYGSKELNIVGRTRLGNWVSTQDSALTYLISSTPSPRLWRRSCRRLPGQPMRLRSRGCRTPASPHG